MDDKMFHPELMVEFSARHRAKKGDRGTHHEKI
jgi:hypothetical protein